MQDIMVHSVREFDLLGFLSSQGFEVEVLSEHVFKITRDAEELPVYLSHNDGALYFEVDLGNVSDIADQNLLQELMDLNTEVLPVSFGFNTTNVEDPRLVLVESRVTGDLSDEELLSVFNALSIATDKAERVLATRLS